MNKQWDRFTPETMNVLSHAQREAITLQHNHLGTAHLVLGVLVEGTSAAAKLLQSAGVRYEEALKILAVLLKEPRTGNRVEHKHWHVS